MLLGVIADDFTGASDIANTLSKGLREQGGLRTTQYLGVPQHPPDPDVEAGVISLKTRSVSAERAVSVSLDALRWLRDQGCRQVVFKYCSTFDSTPEGNIGPVAEALARELGVAGVVVCPAFPTVGRTVYQGHLFVNDRPLNESGMQNHPLNPMTDADIRRWLSRQCTAPVGFVAWPIVERGATDLRDALDRAAKASQTLVIVDAVRDEDLITIGRACRNAPLVTGGSGIAIALPDNFIAAGAARGSQTQFRGIAGPEAVLAGSCSGATLRQIEVHATDHPALNIDLECVMSGKLPSADLVEFVLVNEGNAPLIYSSGTPDQVLATQQKYGRERIAASLDRLFAEVARTLVGRGVRRLVVAGGETSGAVVSALGLDELTIGPEIDPGVPVLFTKGERPLALALKSGNFGTPNFFSKALNRLQSGPGR
jgi:uncharacterized protein YgbK (DUF1537 family)